MPPIALCEVQAYVFAARRAAAEVARALGNPDLAARLTEQADALRERFDAAFWDPTRSFYCFALDGDKKPCRVLTPTPGTRCGRRHRERAHARIMADALLSADAFSGWGVRTVAAGQRRFNPMSYHDGSVWPHDNALIAAGLGAFRAHRPRRARPDGDVRSSPVRRDPAGCRS